eukprot:scaffold66075_cov62-Phaeocystis_antarctica.AAC.1
MVSHTTRLVCYEIPLCPGPSHPDLSIYLSRCTAPVVALYHNLQPNLENRPATDRGAPTCHRRCHMSAEWVMEDAGFADGAGDEHDQMMQECAACWGCALPS